MTLALLAVVVSETVVLPTLTNGVDYAVAKGGSLMITGDAGLPDNANLDFECPSWASRLCVEDGEIVIYTKPDPFFMLVR